MTGVAIVIGVDATGAAEAFGRLRAAGEDLGPLLIDIGAELEASTVERFDTNVAPDGTPWRPSLRAQTEGGRTLVDQGHLRDSVGYRVDGADAVEVGAGGIAAAYASVHQVGATITAKGEALKFRLATGAFATVKSVTIPARPYLGLSAEDRSVIPQLGAEHLARAFAGGPP